MRIHLPEGIGMRRALFGLTGLLVAAAAEAQPDFRLDTRPEALVAEYREVIGGIASEDPGPRVSLFGGGRVEVHVPAYLKGAGDFELELGPAALRAFVADLIDLGLVDFDPAAARAAIRARETGAAELFESSDPSTSEFRLELESFSAPGRAPGTVRKQIRWVGLSEAAERHPEAPGLRRLELARQRFEAFRTHPDLRAVEPEEE